MLLNGIRSNSLLGWDDQSGPTRPEPLFPGPDHLVGQICVLAGPAMMLCGPGFFAYWPWIDAFGIPSNWDKHGPGYAFWDNEAQTSKSGSYANVFSGLFNLI